MVDKLVGKHGVEKHEVEEVIFGSPLIVFIESGDRPGEDVYNALGQTESGRRLIVAFIQKAGGKIIVFSARDMVPKEKRRYEKKKS
ncbi:MAG: BrnT family toxin [Candidatus Ozemobacteraceae bacterium]